MRLRLCWRRSGSLGAISTVSKSDWKWLCLMIVLLLDFLLVLSFLQLVLTIVLFKLGNLPDALLIGGILAIAAVRFYSDHLEWRDLI